MATKNKKVKYKALDIDRFINDYNDIVPGYNELCKGQSVDLDENNKIIKNLLINNVLIKE